MSSLTLRRRRRTFRALSVIVFFAFLAVLIVIAQSDGGGGKNGRAAAADKLPCPEVDLPETSRQVEYDGRPEVAVEAGVDYSAVIDTSCGAIEMDLLEETAPQTVANFAFLAQEGFYDGLTWPRIEDDFLIQTGDPNGIVGDEADGPGYTIPDELPETGRDYVYGVVAMANDGPGTGGSQFFIVVHDPENKEEQAGLEPEYSIFGRVTEASYETLEKIAAMPVKGGDDLYTAVQPVSPVVIESVEIRTSS